MNHQLRGIAVSKPIIVLAGASGDLGYRIAQALLDRGAEVRALVRNDVTTPNFTRLAFLGANPVGADVHDVRSVAAACAGADCVVSALNGLHEVIVDRQTVLLDGAVAAGVPRFISSDFSADFTQSTPGRNRNFDLRREFMARAESAPIKVTSILNGAFMDMLGAEMPIIQSRIRRILYWRDRHQLLDFTTKNNVATYTAAAALDESTPRILRIAGGSISAAGLAIAMSTVTGRRYRTLRAGGIGALGLLIGITQRLAPQPTAPFPPWQGMQYLRDMFSGQAKLHPLDNKRYPDLSWTSVEDHLESTQS